MSVIEMEKKQMRPKRISVSSKRQITIPLEYFKTLHIENEVECYLENNSIVIKPISLDTQDEFSEYILKDLLDEGYSGNELLNEFKKRKNKIKYGIKEIVKEADLVAESPEEYSGIDDIFEKEE